MDIDGGFLLVALACLVVTVALSADAAVAYGVVPPLRLGGIVRLRAAEMSSGGKLVTVVGGAVVATVAQLMMVASVADAYTTRDAQRMAVAAGELAGAGVWLAGLWQSYRSRHVP
jgi:hypothetical protein